uniref:Ig-like domain-containing protein n=1 Tax=Theropithecus gelada TaxID=9565 RepID=A0A8D2EM41_THEGE
MMCLCLQVLSPSLVLTESPSLSASPGASARLTCTLSSDINVNVKSISWYQQRPGNHFQYLLSYYSDSVKHQGYGVPGHFSGSKDASSRILHVSGLQPEDKADHHCKIRYDSINAYTVLQTHREVSKKPLSTCLVWCIYPGGGFDEA